MSSFYTFKTDSAHLTGFLIRTPDYDGDIATHTLPCAQPGTYVEVALADGNIECSIDVAISSTTTGGHNVGVQLIDRFFRFVRWAAANTPRVRSRVIEHAATEDDGQNRYSRIFDGSIAPLDNSVVTRLGTSITGVIMYRIRWTRAPWFEYDANSFLEFTTSSAVGEVHQIRDIFNQVAGKYRGGDRIKRLTVRSSDGSIASLHKMWIGIQDNIDETGGENQYNPIIDMDLTKAYTNSPDPNQSQVWPGTIIDQGMDWSGSRWIKIGFIGGHTEWERRFYIPMRTWNATLAGDAAARANMIGEHILLMRYGLSTDPVETEIGIRATTYWANSPATPLDSPPVTYLKPDDWVNARLQTISLGKINIGGADWSYESTEYQDPEWFCIGMETALFGDPKPNDNTLYLYIDRLILIPTAHYVALEANTPTTPVRFMDVLTDDAMQVTGSIVHDVLTAGSSDSIVGAVQVIESENWFMPEYPIHSNVVVVAEGNQKEHAGKPLRVTFTTVQRTQRYL
jgi:hypothetical protein